MPRLSVTEAAQELQTTSGTLYRWIRAGIVQAERITSGAPYRILLREELRQQFCDGPPEGYVPLEKAMQRLSVTRQRIWQRVRNGDLEACHVRRGSLKGLYIRLEEPNYPLFSGLNTEDRRSTT